MNGSTLLICGFIYFNPRFSIELIKATSKSLYYVADFTIDKTIKSYKFVNKNII